MHHSAMQTHAEIVKRAGGPKVMTERLGLPSKFTVVSWVQRNSIPAEHWAQIAALDIASLDELAKAAASRQRN